MKIPLSTTGTDRSSPFGNPSRIKPIVPKPILQHEHTARSRDFPCNSMELCLETGTFRSTEQKQPPLPNGNSRCSHHM